jgi:hypothetical protein
MISSKTKFPYRVRIHGKECGAVARALHHETKTQSLSAVLENVSSTTFERKLMSKKTSFKRLALALVVALGFGALSVSPSTAVSDEVLTLGTPSATTVEIGESVTVSIDLSFVADSNNESRTVVVTQTGNGFNAAKLIPVSTDSANVTSHGNVAAASGSFTYTERDAIAGAAGGDSIVATTAFTYTRAKWTLRLSNAANAGTYTYVVSSRANAGDNTSTNPGTLGKSATFVVTVTAGDTTGTASKTLMYLNETAIAYGSAPNAIRNNGLSYLAADSSIVANAGVATTPQMVGALFIEPRNASDTRTSTASRTTGNSDVTATVNVIITGAGLVSKGYDGTKSVSINAVLGDTVIVWSNGTSGTATITGYIGGVALTQAAKTVTFVGLADTFIATVETSTVAAGSTAAGAITFIAKDSAGNAITGTNTQYRTGYAPAFVIMAADTAVVGNGWTSVNRAAGSTEVYSTSACTYNTTRAKWVCNIPVTDSGVATTLYIGDSYTATSSLKKSQAITLTVAGTGYTGTAAFDKATYNIGEKAILTVTSKDSGGRNVVDGDSSPWAASVRWTTNSATFSASSGADSTGGTFTDIVRFLNSTDANTFVDGVDTAVVFMPTIAGTYSLAAKATAGSGAESTLLTFTVVDPSQAANLAAIAAAQAAADASADAAAEAIDAANAATDAANLAAEAADAATVAAEEARDAADAATAAVEELATQVATLMAALKAQITTLANTVAKIAKKVKA